VIESEGLADRLIRVPVEADNFLGLIPQKDRLLYVTSDAFYYGRDPQRKTTLHAFDFEKRESSEIAKDILDAAATRDGKYVIVQNKDGFQRVEIGKPDEEPAAISLDNLVVYRAPAVEWAVMFDEVWRRFRDYFYVRNLHGYDWQALRNRYRPLLDDISTREDLNTLIGEMIAELNVGHAYIQDGDLQAGPRPTVALLGARFEADPQAGRYRIAHLYAGHNAEPKYRSPLTEVGVGVRVGDYVLSIDGHALTTEQNPYQLLTGRGTQPVELLVNDRPVVEGARRVLADPIASESALDYLEWVQHNYDYVAQQTAGRVGYLHIPDMGAAGIYEFIKWYYPQLRKQGLVVDVRGNGGGNVSQMILRRLMLRPLGYSYEAHSTWATPYPYTAFNGPMAALISEDSASDGDIFPYFFREAGLGPLIGKRTWGGVVGISDHGPLLDGGQVFVPESGSASTDSRWIIEGVGVTPDIEVDNDPASLQDAQLDRGIQEVLQRIEANPPSFPPKPPEPVKTQ
jgi:tricorn protease